MKSRLLSFLAYYKRLLLMAFRESIDSAQAVVFIVLIVLGGAAPVLPNPTEMNQLLLDVESWKGAAYVLGAIVFARLIVAPFNLFQEDEAKTKTLQQDIDKRKNPLAIRFDLANQSNRFWFLRFVGESEEVNPADYMQVVQYAVELVNVSDETVYDVQCFREEDGILTALTFTENDKPYSDLHPGTRQFVNIWTHNEEASDMMRVLGDVEPLKAKFDLVVYARDKMPTRKPVAIDTSIEPAITLLN